mgnify:FL=1
MGFAKPIEQYLFSNLLIRIHVFMYLKDIIRGRKKEEHNFMGESCFIWRIDCCRNMETGKSERNLEKSFIKGRMPGNHFRSSRHVL